MGATNRGNDASAPTTNRLINPVDKMPSNAPQQARNRSVWLTAVGLGTNPCNHLFIELNAHP